MSLISAVDLRALHAASNQISACIKHPATISSSSHGQQSWANPQYPISFSKKSQPAVPFLDIFTGLDAVEEGSLPSVAQCAVHLEFLAALHELRHRILESEDLDNIFDTKVTKRTVIRKGEQVELKDDTLLQRRQVKWETYVSIAVVRFLAWWKTTPDVFRRKGQFNIEAAEAILPPLGRRRPSLLARC